MRHIFSPWDLGKVFLKFMKKFYTVNDTIYRNITVTHFNFEVGFGSTVIRTSFWCLRKRWSQFGKNVKTQIKMSKKNPILDQNYLVVNAVHRSLEYIDWARAEFTCSDLSCLAERLGDFEKFPLPWLGEAHSTSHLGNQANRARSPRLSSWAACRLIYVFPLSLKVPRSLVNNKPRPNFCHPEMNCIF